MNGSQIDNDHFESIIWVPAAEASIDDVIEFCHTYDAMGTHGSLDGVSRVSDAVLDARERGRLGACELDDLRTALFMTQQARRWSGQAVADASQLGYEWELVDAIRESSGGLVRDDRPILI